MNSNTIVKIGFAFAIAAVPYQAEARTARAGLDACAEAMVSELAASQGSPLVYNLDPESKGTGSALKRREIFHLDATDASGQKVVARVDCVVNGRAEVVRMTRIPVDGPDARLRATKAY